MFERLAFARFALGIVMACGSVAAFAAADPTVDDIYRATAAGQLDQAQTMIAQVLRDHPNSARAHYVASEVYARAGHTAQARQQLDTAQSIDPKLSFASPAAVSGLRAQLNQAAGSSTMFRQPAKTFPMGWVLVLGGAVLALWLLFRRRPVQQPMGVPGPLGAMGGGPYANPGAGPYGYGPQGYGPQGPFGGSPAGSGLGHSLASGLAVGAGVVAGEELVRHFVDGEHRGPIGSGFEESGAPPSNGDMGGNDFGVSDPGGSWDDGGGGDFGGGGDWS